MRNIRLKIIVIGLGAFIIFMGFQEFSLSQGTSDAPLEITLEEIEEGNIPENTHLQIGPHWQLFPLCIYEYETDNYSDTATASSKVNYVYYPIISDYHPYFYALDELYAFYGSYDDIPDSQWPEIEEVSVIVKTTKYQTIGAIPDDWGQDDNVTGVIINRIQQLDSEEEKLLKESFPDQDFSKVLILEAGRKPTGALLSIIIMAAGAALAAIGVLWIIKDSQKGQSQQ